MEPFEAYVLCQNRSTVLGLEFLNTFVPRRTPVADEFPYPELTESPLAIYQTAEDVMRRLELETEENYALYWDGDENQYASQGMLFFTKDGGMIAGLALTGKYYAKTLLDIANVVGGQFGIITSENRPPDTKAEFIDMCRKSTLPSLVDGQIQLTQNQ